MQEMTTVREETLVYNTIGQHKIIVSYTFCKLSLYTIITYTNMVFQGQVIQHTIKTSLTSLFDRKLKVNLI